MKPESENPPILCRIVTVQTLDGPVKLEVELHADCFALRRPPAGKRVEYDFTTLWRWRAAKQRQLL